MQEGPSSQSAQRFVELTRVAVRLLRHGPRELALATAGFLALAMPALLPKAEDLPAMLQPFWPWLAALSSFLGIGLLAFCVVIVYRKATAPLPEPGEPVGQGSSS